MFFILVLFWVLLWVNRYVFLSKDFRVLVTLFQYFFYLFGVAIMFSRFLYFEPKLFCTFCWYVFEHSPFIAGRIIFHCFGMCSFFFLYCLIQSPYLFSLPSFASNFRYISSNCIVCFNCCFDFSFSPKHIPFLFLWLVCFFVLFILPTWASPVPAITSH